MNLPTNQSIWYQQTLEVSTDGRDTIDITRMVADVVIQAGVSLGLCHIFVQHTSASVIITENADRNVHDDLERFMQSTVPDSNHLYRHDSEGPDDMPSHIRSVLTNASLLMPVSKGQLTLGIWQGIYLWEHRLRPHTGDYCARNRVSR